MRRSLLLASLLLPGCFAVMEPSLRQQAAEYSGCPADQLDVEPLSTLQGVRWSATGCGRSWECSSVSIGGPGSPARTDCKETAASEAHTTASVARDRLQLETNCPPDQIRLVRQAEWRRGTETAYRFEACGRPYVCTSAAGRTDCKLALAE